MDCGILSWDEAERLELQLILPHEHPIKILGQASGRELAYDGAQEGAGGAKVTVGRRCVKPAPVRGCGARREQLLLGPSQSSACGHHQPHVRWAPCPRGAAGQSSPGCGAGAAAGPWQPPARFARPQGSGTLSLAWGCLQDVDLHPGMASLPQISHDPLKRPPIVSLRPVYWRAHGAPVVRAPSEAEFCPGGRVLLPGAPQLAGRCLLRALFLSRAAEDVAWD